MHFSSGFCIPANTQHLYNIGANTNSLRLPCLLGDLEYFHDSFYFFLHSIVAFYVHLKMANTIGLLLSMLWVIYLAVALNTRLFRPSSICSSGGIALYSGLI